MRPTRQCMAALLFISILILAAASTPDNASAENGTLASKKIAAKVILIESPGCSKCAAAERTMEKVGREVPLNITRHYYYSEEGHRIIKQYGAKDVPAIITGMQVINYRDYNGNNSKLEKLIREAIANQTFSPPAFTLPGSDGAELLESPGNETGLDLQDLSLYTISAVLGAGLVAGFNPCLLGILVFLAASVLSSNGKRREMVAMVAFFSLGIFTMYFLFGLGMQQLLQAEAAARAFRYILTAFLLLAGFSQVWDALRLNQGRPSLFRTDWALKYFRAGVEKGRFSSYFLIGALFSLVKAPCVGAIYLAILDLLAARSYLEGATYLIFFNLGVVLPIILLGAGIALGLSPEQVDSFRKDHRVGMRLFTGIALLALAPLIFWQLI